MLATIPSSIPAAAPVNQPIDAPTAKTARIAINKDSRIRSLGKRMG